MEPFPFFERARNARKVPRVVMRAKRVRSVLRSRDPSVVGQSATRVGSIVGVDHLTSRFDSDLRVHAVERELFFVFYKMKTVSVRAAETVAAIDSERVVPDHPTATVKANFLRSDL